MARMERADLRGAVDAVSLVAGALLVAKVARGGLGAITPGDVMWAAALALVRSSLR